MGIDTNNDLELNMEMMFDSEEALNRITVRRQVFLTSSDYAAPRTDTTPIGMITSTLYICSITMVDSFTPTSR